MQKRGNPMRISKRGDFIHKTENSIRQVYDAFLKEAKAVGQYPNFLICSGIGGPPSGTMQLFILFTYLIDEVPSPARLDSKYVTCNAPFESTAISGSLTELPWESSPPYSRKAETIVSTTELVFRYII